LDGPVLKTESEPIFSFLHTPNHFDITYLVFNIQFHRQIMTFNSLPSLMFFTNFSSKLITRCGGCVNSSLLSTQTQQSTDVSHCVRLYTVGHKKCASKLLSKTLAILNRF